MSEEEKDGLDKEFDVTEAARYLAALQIVDHPPHPETIREWIREGRLRAHKDKTVRGRGGAWRITLADLLAFDPGRSRGKRGRPRKDLL